MINEINDILAKHAKLNANLNSEACRDQIMKEIVGVLNRHIMKLPDGSFVDLGVNHE